MARFVMKMPDIGEGVVDAEIVEWHVQPGSEVKEDQHIVDVMTDKATVEMSAPVAGTVLEISGEPGSRIVVGAPLIVFETAAPVAVGEDAAVNERLAATSVVAEAPAPVPALAGNSGVPAAEQTERVAVATSAPAPVAAVAHSRGERRAIAAPSVRRRAREARVDLEDVPATGSGGRVTHEDLDRYVAGRSQGSGLGEKASQPAAPAVAPLVADQSGIRQVRIIGLRRVIAEKMALSTRRIPHYSYVEEVDVTELQALVDHMNASKSAQQAKLSFLPFIMKALAKALRDFPHCNALFDDEAGVLTEFDAVHIGVATATPNGLMVPVVRQVQSLDLWQAAAEVQRLSVAARAGKCAREELSGSTITITSLGKLGGIASTPVINHPEVAILGVNRAVERPMVHNGAIVVRRMMNLSASFDHRIVDGYDGARLIQALKGLLEFPASIFI